jgi:integrase
MDERFGAAANGVVLPFRRKVKEWESVPGCEYLVRRLPAGVYYVRKKKAGKGRLFESLGTTSKVNAKRIADERIAEWLGGKRQALGKRPRVEAVVPQCLEQLERQASTKDKQGFPLRAKRTADKDRTYLAPRKRPARPPLMTELFGEFFMDELDEQAWDAWLKRTGYRLGRDLGEIAKYLSILADYAFREKLIGRKPRFANPETHETKARVYEDADLISYHEHAEPMLQDMLEFVSEVPIRPHEIRELRWEFVRFDRDHTAEIHLPAWFPKNRKARAFRAGPNGSAMLWRRYRERLLGSEFVFPAPKDPKKPISDVMISRLWRRMIARLNEAREKENLPPVPAGKFHWTRHSAYTKVILDAQENIAKVSEVGGTAITTLQKNYLKSDPRRTASVGQAIKIAFNRRKHD